MLFDSSDEVWRDIRLGEVGVFQCLLVEDDGYLLVVFREAYESLMAEDVALLSDILVELGGPPQGDVLRDDDPQAVFSHSNLAITRPSDESLVVRHASVQWSTWVGSLYDALSNTEIARDHVANALILADLDVQAAAEPVKSSDLSLLDELGREEDEERLGDLTRAVEPLYHALWKALDDGRFAEDEEKELEVRDDLAGLRRELWETRRVRTRLLYDYASIAAKALADLEQDHAVTDLMDALVSTHDTPLDSHRAIEVRDAIAGELPDSEVPDGFVASVVVDQAMGWRKHFDYGDTGVALTLGSVVGSVVAAVGLSVTAGIVLGAIAGVVSAVFVVRGRRGSA